MNTEKIKQLRAKAERDLAEAKRLEELIKRTNKQCRQNSGGTNAAKAALV